MNIIVKKMILGPVRTNCYIVYKLGGNEAVIIDPADHADEIERELTSLNLNPVAILLTHGHFDHVGAVDMFRKRFGIKAYIYSEEKEIIATDKNLARMFGCNVSAKADEYLTDGQKITLAGIEFEVIHTPGHTVGSCCYYVSESMLLFSGDTLFYHSHGRTDFPTGSQSAIIRSISDKLMKLDDNVCVYPGHEEETTIRDERPLYDFN